LSDTRYGRNPFVNQVSFFAISPGPIQRSWPSRNPFVNQVSFFLGQIKKIRRKKMESQSLRKSGQFLFEYQ